MAARVRPYNYYTCTRDGTLPRKRALALSRDKGPPTEDITALSPYLWIMADDNKCLGEGSRRALAAVIDTFFARYLPPNQNRRPYLDNVSRRSAHAIPCHAICHAMPCHAMPCHAMPCHAMPSMANAPLAPPSSLPRLINSRPTNVASITGDEADAILENPHGGSRETSREEQATFLATTGSSAGMVPRVEEAIATVLTLQVNITSAGHQSATTSAVRTRTISAARRTPRLVTPPPLLASLPFPSPPPLALHHHLCHQPPASSHYTGRSTNHWPLATNYQHQPPTTNQRHPHYTSGRSAPRLCYC